MNLRDYEGIILQHENDVGKAYNHITWKVKNGKCYYSNELRSIEGYLMYHTDEQKSIEDMEKFIMQYVNSSLYRVLGLPKNQNTFIEIEEANYA